MKEDICSIPINEVFEKQDGCPFCRMERTLEERVLDFILGDAMMEPDVRLESNRTGFCARHYAAMFSRRQHHALGLMLETHLAQVEKEVFEKGGSGLFRKPSKAGGTARKIADSCYICSRVENGMEKMLNTFFVMWKGGPEFRDHFAAQPAVCLPHYALILERGEHSLGKKDFADFSQEASGVAKAGFQAVKNDVGAFCKLFDYRNIGKNPETAKAALERAIRLLAGDI